MDYTSTQVVRRGHPFLEALPLGARMIGPVVTGPAEDVERSIGLSAQDYVDILAAYFAVFLATLIYIM